MYGLTGEWTWPGTVGGGSRLCLQQQTPVRVVGTMTYRDREPLQIRGAVAPTGELFLHTVGESSSEVVLVAHRRLDTLFVDWAGVPSAGRTPSRDVYGPGIMLRAPRSPSLPAR